MKKNSFEFMDLFRVFKMLDLNHVGYAQMVHLTLMIEAIRLYIMGYLSYKVAVQEASFFHIIVLALIIAMYLVDATKLYAKFKPKKDNALQPFVSKWTLSCWARKIMEEDSFQKMHLNNAFTFRYVNTAIVVMIYLPFLQLVSALWGRVLPTYFSYRYGEIYAEPTTNEKYWEVSKDGNYTLFVNPLRMQVYENEFSIVKLAVQLECDQLNRQIAHLREVHTHLKSSHFWGSQVVEPDNLKKLFSFGSMYPASLQHIDPETGSSWLSAGSVAEAVCFSVFTALKTYTVQELRRAIECAVFEPMTERSPAMSGQCLFNHFITYKVYEYLYNFYLRNPTPYSEWESFKTEVAHHVLENRAIQEAINNYPESLSTIKAI